MKKILIVEDEDALRDLLVKRAKTVHHFDCRIDTSGRDCVSLAESFQPDAILLDMALPDISGFSLLRDLKHNPKTQHIPVIVYSAHNHKEIVDQAIDLGACSYQSKGHSLHNLFETVLQYAT